MREKTLEQKLVRAIKEEGGVCPKLVSPGTNGMPDRMVLLPGGRIGFIELKAPGKKPRPLQRSRIRQLEQLGFKVFVIDRSEQIETILQEIGGDAE